MVIPRLNNCIFISLLLFLLCVGTASADDNITFTTTGATFHPIITVTGTPTIEWNFHSDGNIITSDSASPTVNYTTTGTRNCTLKVTPWSAVEKINIGYDAGDGGAIETETLLDPQHVSNISGLENVAPYVRILLLSSSASDRGGNSFTTLTLDNFTNLEDVECMLDTHLTTVSLKNLPKVRRLCFEECIIENINLTDCPNLEDLRAHQITTNPITVTWGDYTYPNLWHICVRDNPTQTMPIDFKKFPALQQYWCWNDVFSGELRTYSDHLNSVIAYGTQYTSGYFYGQFSGNSELDMHSTPLSKINIFNNHDLKTIDLHSCMLNQTEIDNVLLAADLGENTDGTLDISGNTYPSDTGMQYLTNLQNKSWDVTYDAQPTPSNNTPTSELAYVKGVGTEPGGNFYVTISNVTAGNCLAVFVASFHNGAPAAILSAPTDSLGDTFTACGPQYNETWPVVAGQWYYGFASASGDITVTGHSTGGDYDSIKVVEISGINQTAPVTFSNGASSETTQFVTTTDPDQIMLVGFHAESLTYSSIDNGFAPAATVASGLSRPVFYYIANETKTNFGTTLRGTGSIYGNWFIGLEKATSNDTTSYPSEITADFIYDKIDVKHGIIGFHDNSTGVNITSWEWSFGDGSENSTLQNPTHFYSGLGTYNVSLTVSNDTMTDSVFKILLVDPVVSWSDPSNITYGTALSSTHLNAQASVDGTFSYDPLSGTVLSAGTHTLNATFTPTDLDNYSVVNASVEINITKATPTITWADPTSIVSGTALSGTQLNAVGSVAGSFVYDPASGTVLDVGSHTLNTTFTPTDSTNYTTATDSATIEVTESETSNPPVAAFSANVTSGTEPLTVAFTDSSTYSPTSWLWNFGDDYTSVSQNPTHTYLTAGTYTVSLRATNADGSDYENKTGYITVSEAPVLPVASFTANVSSGQAPLNVSFTDTSTNTTSWSWAFGDDNTSTDQNPVHTFYEVGTYTVTLTATNANGTDTASSTIVARGEGQLDLTNYDGSNFTASTGIFYVGQYDVVDLVDRLYYNRGTIDLSGINIYYVYKNDVATVRQNITCSGNETGYITIPVNATNSGTDGVYFGQFILYDGETRLTIPSRQYIVMYINEAL